MATHRLLFFVVLLGRVAAAQATDTTRRAPGATVSGIVHDSIARRPLAGATVQLVSADGQVRTARTTTSDSLGRFSLDDVPNGRHTLGFFHAVLDSLGLEPPLREVFVADHRPARADLAIPAPARVRAAMCGPRPEPDSSGVVVGIVRTAVDRLPAPRVTVTAEWLELSFTPNGLVRHVPRLVATTAENGWFAICDVPSAATIALMARRGTDSTESTDVIDVQVPAQGFVRQSLYLGSARMVAISGTVVTAAGSQPLGGAQVGIVGGPQTRANDRGQWTIANAPLGTRVLEVRAVSYFPERRAVDVVADAAPVRVALTTLKAMLDTVKVFANPLYDRDGSGFQQRRNSGTGRYLTAEDVARSNPIVTSDLFRMQPGVRMVDNPREFDKVLLVRSSTTADWCPPAVYVNGQYVFTASASDIDGWVNPEEIAGVEIYSGTSVPPQFQRGMTNCGSIVIWTRRVGPIRKMTKGRVAAALGAVAVGLAIGALLQRSR
jgi:hypothetical protein